ncbi:MAG: hypothetical protein A2X84_04450 [Desulfuromonadaceae bacterium GWC2_58_13]|nr:MAG: hypothetical protein A2X84_04450 [Desulfuromonadaceae bacterium GWC2_58_13]
MRKSEVFLEDFFNQNRRVPARQPGYFSLNVKKSNQKKLATAWGMRMPRIGVLITAGKLISALLRWQRWYATI